MRLPIGPFFSLMSALLALMAVIFTGHGIAALQEAGVVALTPLNFDRIQLLGLYPSREVLVAQLVVLGLIGAGFWSAHHGALT